jgi:hypothetical protein
MILGITALAIATMAATVLAQEPQPQPQPKPTSEKSFTGEIVSVDPSAKTLVVKEAALPSSPAPQPGQRPEAAAGKSMTFVVDDHTRIGNKMADPAKALELGDLEPGNAVLVRYTASEGKNIAKSIEVVEYGTTSSN